MNALKAKDPSDASDAIVVSFDGRWLEPLQNGDVSLVFRKRGPTTLIPRQMYVYVGAPHSVIIGRFPVLGYEHLPVDAALKRTAHARISKEELAQYLVEYTSVAAFRVGALDLSPSPQSLVKLKTKFSFTPPQSFFVLSRDGHRLLDAALKLPIRRVEASR